MALTVRPDDEVYQFDTVWLGPDEYTLPIQARYVAWGTWLACFLVAAVVLIPLGGDGPAQVFGSLIWALGVSVVLSRAVMLVVDHERPLRSLPALFSSEARAALQARRRAERALLVRPARIRVRETPPKVLAMRERQRTRAAAKADRGAVAPVEAPVAVAVAEPTWTPDPVAYAEPVPAWSVPTDGGYEADDVYAPAPVTYGAAYPATPHRPTPHRPARHVVVPEPVAPPARYEPVRPATTPRHAAAGTGHHAAAAATRYGATQNGDAHHGTNGATRYGATPNGGAPNGDAHHGTNGVTRYGATPNGPTPNGGAPAGQRPANPFRSDPHQPDDRPAPYRGPVTVGPTDGRHARARDQQAGGPADGQAAIEARILLPARKDR